MHRSSRKPVRIIDHEPLDHTVETSRAHTNAPIFGKRGSTSGSTDDHAANGADEPYAPFASNGISEYFINRVSRHQEEKRRNGQDNMSGSGQGRSAIRNTGFSDGDLDEEAGIPLASIAAVIGLAFAIPLGFIYATENLGGFSQGASIDPMTTASIRTADGLEVRDVSMTRILKNGTFVVTIHGQIANLSSKPATLMPLTISLQDGDGNEVQSWRHRVGKSELDKASKIHFMASAIDFSGKAKTARVVARAARSPN